jgi:hypothetical protein
MKNIGYADGTCTQNIFDALLANIANVMVPMGGAS